jgi:hypothetical protein
MLYKLSIISFENLIQFLRPLNNLLFKINNSFVNTFLNKYNNKLVFLHKNKIINKCLIFDNKQKTKDS